MIKIVVVLNVLVAKVCFLFEENVSHSLVLLNLIVNKLLDFQKLSLLKLENLLIIFELVHLAVEEVNITKLFQKLLSKVCFWGTGVNGHELICLVLEKGLHAVR